jgi:hypothetical protein
MELTIMERLALLQILPQQGNVATLRIVRKLREDLSFTEDEIKAFDIIIEEGRITWDEVKAKPRGYEFGATAHKTIIDTLEKLDNEGKVEIQHLSLMDKFGIGE